MAELYRKRFAVRQPVEAVEHFVGGAVIDIADEAQRDVVVFGVHPAGAVEPAALERKRQSHLRRDFEAGKESGQMTLLSSGARNCRPGTLILPQHSKYQPIRLTLRLIPSIAGISA